MAMEGDPTVARARDELLWQMADDNLLIGFRAGEWLGLGPHIEEDITFASIGQDAMGHALRWYELLETIGYGPRDDLAMLRAPGERRNSVLAEWPNGPGGYMADPHFDWAFTIVRHYFFDVWEMIRLDGVARSGFEPLAQTAAAIAVEKPFHRTHQEQWLTRMARGEDLAREHLTAAVQTAANLAGDLWPTSEQADLWDRLGIWKRAEDGKTQWANQVGDFFAALSLTLPPPDPTSLNGRRGEHSEHLKSALAVMSEVYRVDPSANW